ncbi:MAG: hypothetical protein ABI193_08110 [Minicystis sp.]
MDRYIDNGETQVYGPKLRANLGKTFTSSSPQVKAFLTYLDGLQADADASMANGMAKARGATSDLSAAALSKSPEADDARKLLTGLHKHLGAKLDLGDWSGDVKLFFPKGLTGIGISAPDIASALATAQKGFEKDSSVPDGKKLKTRLAAAEKKLRAAIAKSGGAITAARTGLSEQSAEKKAWLACYRGIALIAEGVLTLEKRPTALKTVVPHLSVPGGKKGKAKETKVGGEGKGTP